MDREDIYAGIIDYVRRNPCCSRMEVAGYMGGESFIEYVDDLIRRDKIRNIQLGKYRMYGSMLRTPTPCGDTGKNRKGRVSRWQEEKPGVDHK